MSLDLFQKIQTHTHKKYINMHAPNTLQCSFSFPILHILQWTPLAHNTVSYGWKLVQHVFILPCTVYPWRESDDMYTRTLRWIMKQRWQLLGGMMLALPLQRRAEKRSTGQLYCSHSCWLTLYITSEGETGQRECGTLIKQSEPFPSVLYLLPLLYPLLFKVIRQGVGSREGQLMVTTYLKQLL